MKYLPKILLVDDEVDHLHLLTALLRENGFDVYSIASPDELFATMKSFKPGIILLDVRLGNYDGKEICSRLKKDETTKGVKIILHSAFPEIEKEYALCGADEFILKPTNVAHLVDRLRYHLNNGNGSSR